MTSPAWRDLRGQLPGSETYQRRKLTDVRYLVIHHTAVDVDNTAEEIARYHVQQLGWPGIGYHFVVHPDGGIDYVGDIGTVRYNVAKRNQECIGICLTGDFSNHWPSEEQLRSARSVIHAMRLFVPTASVVGHRDIAVPGWETSCPGETWHEWRNLVEATP